MPASTTAIWATVTKKATEKQRALLTSWFTHTDVDLLCVTKSFGVGLIINTVDATVHLQCSGSVPEFWQEALRAGRVITRAAHSTVLVSDMDKRTRELLTAGKVVTEDGQEVNRTSEVTQRSATAGRTRALHFHAIGAVPADAIDGGAWRQVHPPRIASRGVMCVAPVAARPLWTSRRRFEPSSI